MSLPTLSMVNLGVLMLVTFGLWLLSVRLRDASIIDIFWGTGFVIVAWTSAALSEWPAARAILVVGMTTVWGLRLGIYLAWRNIGEAEDRRYRAMRDQWGKRFPVVSLFTVFWLQAVVLWLVSLPLQASAYGTDGLGLLDAVGVAVWSVGLFFESVGDLQLARFKAEPRNEGKVLDHGLWRYTRHPNYFGDFLVWWGFFLVAASGGAWWTVLSPLIMSVLLMKVSGVTLLERSLTDRKPEYEAYVKRTSAFFPWPPKNDSA